MPLPTFLIIGAAKSGTSSFAAYLSQHPEVFIPHVKEPNYFALAGRAASARGPVPEQVIREAVYNWSQTDWPGYCRLFDGAEGKAAIGEASVRYLYFDEAPGRIRGTLPDVRLVAILRDPIGRLYSHYVMNRQMNRTVSLEPLSLASAIEAEPARIADGWGWDWHYVAAGLYAHQLRRYFELFPREQILVLLYDDLVRDPLGAFRAVCRHIGVDEGFVPDMGARAMVGTHARNERLGRWLWRQNKLRGIGRYLRPATAPIVRRLKAWNEAPVPKLDPELRAALIPRFRDDLDELARLIGREIPWYR
jgi:hypothetical protein